MLPLNQITSFAEIFAIAITALAISYIFTAFVPKKQFFKQIRPGVFKPSLSLFDVEEFKMAAMIGIPAIILHELFHKFASLALGIPAFYNMSLFGLAIGIVLRAIGSGIIFFIPGYVQIVAANTTPWQTFIISFAGPFANLLLFTGAILTLKYAKLSSKWKRILYLTKRINIWLFILNMLPIPPLDGSKVIISLFNLIGGIL